LDDQLSHYDRSRNSERMTMLTCVLSKDLSVWLWLAGGAMPAFALPAGCWRPWPGRRGRWVCR